MTQDDMVVRRLIAAVQLGLLAGLAGLLLGPETVELTRSMSGQLSVLLLAATGALLIERRTRPAVTRG